MEIDPLKMMGPKIENVVYSEKQLSIIQYILNMKLRADSKVTNFEQGWLSLPWITDEVDVFYQRLAAILISRQLSKYQSNKPDRIIPVPMMGLPFATTLSEETGILLNMSRKSKHAPQSWEHAIVTPNKPYQNGGLAYHAYHFKPGQKILIADDVLGEGDTVLPIINEFRKNGAIIDFAAFYVIKLYRSGYEKLSALGVQPFGALNIRGFTPEGKPDIKSIASS